MGRDAGAAAHVHDHIVAVLIAFAHQLTVVDGHLFHVQGMGVGGTVQAADAGHAGHVAQLVRAHGIDEIGGYVQLTGDFGRQNNAQRGRVVDALHVMQGVLIGQVVDEICTARTGVDAHAPAGHSVNGFELHLGAPEHVPDHLLPPGHLIHEIGAVREGLLGGVHIQIQQDLVPSYQPQLGPGRARIHGQDRIGVFHFGIPPIFRESLITFRLQAVLLLCIIIIKSAVTENHIHSFRKKRGRFLQTCMMRPTRQLVIMMYKME